MRRRHLLRFVAHAVFAFVALALAQVHAVYIGDYALLDSARVIWLALFAASTITATYGLGLPDEATGASSSRVGAAIVAVLFSAVVISLVQLAVGSALLPRFVVFWASAFAIPWYALMAAIGSDLHLYRPGSRILLVASAEEADVVRTELKGQSENDGVLVGHIDTEEGDVADRIRTMGADLLPDVLVVDRVSLSRPDVVAAAAALHQDGIRVRTLSLFYEEWLGKLPLSELEQVSLMFDIGEVHRRLYARQKRMVDVAVALIAMPVLLVATVLVAVLNPLVNRGPVMYKQLRVGRYGRQFTIYKFRSMRPSSGSEWTTPDDKRITKFGGLLRRSHLDELPQAINMLKGELSLVGPRPEQPQYVAQLSEVIPFYDVRHVIRPGLTGWAQVKYAYGASVRDAHEKLQYDFYYLRRQSLQLDLRIVVRTARAVLGWRGR